NVQSAYSDTSADFRSDHYFPAITTHFLTMWNSGICTNQTLSSTFSYNLGYNQRLLLAYFSSSSTVSSSEIEEDVPDAFIGETAHVAEWTSNYVEVTSFCTEKMADFVDREHWYETRNKDIVLQCEIPCETFLIFKIVTEHLQTQLPLPNHNPSAPAWEVAAVLHSNSVYEISLLAPNDDITESGNVNLNSVNRLATWHCLDTAGVRRFHSNCQNMNYTLTGVITGYRSLARIPCSQSNTSIVPNNSSYSTSCNTVPLPAFYQYTVQDLANQQYYVTVLGQSFTLPPPM